MRYWLMKSEPSECSIDDVARAPNQTVPWVGVRNFQARNFMRNEMQVKDGVPSFGMTRKLELDAESMPNAPVPLLMFAGHVLETGVTSS